MDKIKIITIIHANEKLMFFQRLRTCWFKLYATYSNGEKYTYLFYHGVAITILLLLWISTCKFFILFFYCFLVFFLCATFYFTVSFIYNFVIDNVMHTLSALEKRVNIGISDDATLLLVSGSRTIASWLD